MTKNALLCLLQGQYSLYEGNGVRELLIEMEESDATVVYLLGLILSERLLTLRWVR